MLLAPTDGLRAGPLRWDSARVTRRGRSWAACALLAFCSAGVVTARAGAADRLVTRNAGYGPLDAFGRTFAWGSATSRVVFFGRGRRRTTHVHFEGEALHLGPGRRGAPIAVYSRCKAAGGRCDLFALGLRSGAREHKLRSLLSGRWLQDDVVVWGGHYLFRRTCNLEPPCRGAGLWFWPPLRRVSRTPVDGLDLHGRVAAFTLTARGTDFSGVIRVGYLPRRGRL